MTRLATHRIAPPALLPLVLASAFVVAAPFAAAQESEESHDHESHGQESQGHESHGHESHDDESHGHEAHQHHGNGHEDLHADGFHHDFSDAERWAKVFDDPGRAEWQKPEELLRLVGVASGMRVADIGAGTGFFLGYLAQAVGEQGKVYALDVAEELVVHMRDRAEASGWPNVEARLVAPDDPGLEPASVDRILIVNTWHHIDDRPAYTRRLADGLTPGGSVVVVDYTLESEEGPPKAHRLPAERVVRELEAGGLEAEVLEETL
ncbi:MAG: methyltransferase domain-containing protein, partial [Holophagales bacterium]|nr:methyltransferase domain-containing protein [Holophagales bacterium]